MHLYNNFIRLRMRPLFVPKYHIIKCDIAGISKVSRINVLCKRSSSQCQAESIKCDSELYTTVVDVQVS